MRYLENNERNRPKFGPLGNYFFWLWSFQGLFEVIWYLSDLYEFRQPCSLNDCKTNQIYAHCEHIVLIVLELVCSTCKAASYRTVMNIHSLQWGRWPCVDFCPYWPVSVLCCQNEIVLSTWLQWLLSSPFVKSSNACMIHERLDLLLLFIYLLFVCLFVFVLLFCLFVMCLLVYYSIDWLVDWLIRWLIDWLIDIS